MLRSYQFLLMVTGIFALTLLPSGFVTTQEILVVLTDLALPNIVRFTLPSLSTVMKLPAVDDHTTEVGSAAAPGTS